jgi:uncharacterized membrane protein
MRNQYYTQKELFGGFILLFIFIILFIITVNFTINSIEGGIKNHYFFAPILIALAYGMLAYMFVFNENMNSLNKEMNRDDDFTFKECPSGFNKRIETKEGLPININTNITCEPKDSNPFFDRIFYLSGDIENCGMGDKREENGCFNKYPFRAEKCKRAKKYFEEHQSLLNGWLDYKDNCIE